MKTLKITFFCCLFSLFTYAQTVHTVDNRSESGALFTELQVAIDAAVAGDIIQVHPSPTSYGSVSINKMLTLIGLGHNPANNDGEVAIIATMTFNGNSANSEVKGLRITTINSGSAANSTNLDGIHIINNNITSIVAGSSSANLSDGWIVEGNYFSSTANNITSQMASDNWEMKNNFMRGRFTNINNTCIITNNVMLTALNTFVFFSNCDNPLVNNNIFLATGNLTEVGATNSTITFVSNMTYNFGGGTIDALNGSNNQDNINPLFTNVPLASETDFYNNDYTLGAGSTGINAGSDGTDIGLYGNNFVFDTNGRPNVTPYPESITITNSVVAPDQILNVLFTASQKQ